MTNKDQTTKKNTTTTAKKAETKFPIHELREHSLELFGVKPEVLDGAFFNTKKLEFTKAEAQKQIDSFLKKKVNSNKEVK